MLFYCRLFAETVVNCLRMLLKRKIGRLFVSGVGTIVIGLVSLLLVYPNISALQAQSWPTPTPIARILPVMEVPESQVTPVARSPKPGSTATTLYPKFIVYPNKSFNSPVVLSSAEQDETQQVTLGMSDGTITAPLQVLYQSIWTSQVPSANGGKILRIFRFETYDYAGVPIVPAIRRPFVLSIPYAHLVSSAGEERRLLVARLSDDGDEWLPLVTWLDRENGRIIARVLELGTFGVLSETIPVNLGQAQ